MALKDLIHPKTQTNEDKPTLFIDLIAQGVTIMGPGFAGGPFKNAEEMRLAFENRGINWETDFDYCGDRPDE